MCFVFSLSPSLSLQLQAELTSTRKAYAEALQTEAVLSKEMLYEKEKALRERELHAKEIGDAERELEDARVALEVLRVGNSAVDDGYLDFKRLRQTQDTSN